jgi:hypothetical protein
MRRPRTTSVAGVALLPAVLLATMVAAQADARDRKPKPTPEPVPAASATGHVYALTAAAGSLTPDGNGAYTLLLEAPVDRMIRSADQPELEALDLPVATLAITFKTLFAGDAPDALLSYLPDGGDQAAPALMVLAIHDPVQDPDTGSLTFAADPVSVETEGADGSGTGAGPIEPGETVSFGPATLLIDGPPAYSMNVGPLEIIVTPAAGASRLGLTILGSQGMVMAYATLDPVAYMAAFAGYTPDGAKATGEFTASFSEDGAGGRLSGKVSVDGAEPASFDGPIARWAR